MNPGLTLGRIAGVRISVHWSWLIVFALIAWTLTAAIFPDQNPGLSDAAYAAMAVVASVDVLRVAPPPRARPRDAGTQGADGDRRHHAVAVRRRRGLPRRLFPQRSAELRIALAGPARDRRSVAPPSWLLSGVGGCRRLRTASSTWLAVINLVLLGFNMLPALPLDGGRVLHALVWRWTDDRRVATTVGAGAGRALAIVMIVGGLGLTFAGAGAGGIWFAFLGWFLLQAATAEQRQGVLRGALGDLRVDDLMVHRPVTVPADATLSRLHGRGRARPPVHDLPCRRRRASSSGCSRSRAWPPRRAAGWDEHRVRDCMMLLEDAPVVQTGTPLLEALQDMQRQGGDRALVLDHGELVGLLSITDVGRVVSESAATPHGRRP